jgi:MerR family transcriptional regulator, light-induced transcriptional regulator
MDRMMPSTADSFQEACDQQTEVAVDLLHDDGAQPSMQERMARIVRTIEADIIPRLVRSHRPEPAAPQPPTVPTLDEADIGRFVQLVLAPGEAGWMDTIALLRARGLSVEAIYLDLLGPAARELGRLWEEDLVMFSDVTVAVGRLHRIMRTLSPAFGSEVDVPADGRRVLLLPAPGEQHTFGLSMVAEFFRRAGWDVVCELDSRSADPVALVRNEWFDVIGISVGVAARLDWLRAGISAVRHGSRNKAIGVMVGGPVFAADPELPARLGADATAPDARHAPVLAERLLDERARRLSAATG